jgi:polyisoprenoid-binding protein YceI
MGFPMFLEPIAATIPFSFESNVPFGGAPMSTIDGNWKSDPTHSALYFSVRHSVVATFRGVIDDFAATLTGGENLVIEGTAKVASITTKDPNLTGHLQSPDFFDLERYPEATLRSTSVTRDGDNVTVVADLTLRDVTKSVTFTGTLLGPVEGAFGGEKLGLDLVGTVDRTEFGMQWNAPMPGGGFILSDDVKLHIQLEMDRV